MGSSTRSSRLRVFGVLDPEDVARNQPGTRAATLYRARRATEPYYCNYGLNPSYEGHLADAGVVVSGRGPGGEVRIIELPGHPFFVATQFVPCRQMVEGGTHPIYAGLVEAVRERQQRSAAVQ